ncbi:U4/U6 small nuclear ribonucleoprotein Prp31-like [Gracilariopsis chorda]|uniref:U4/U6 small nuclear ribonucleoprotein Prp31-like n=1 Tax=Gracilariopsis chorda TaxID=448386 RepID=A0A2V3J6H4_9FLOR|nr:U4/U6 small nuclear ribonucleoprotein Prp31-like [Gracilariopsis chorda]|eukprot:PXF49913.1 U4/U6 small nuclear ribonucleoprotein Prp31-like [Gracilariopsis chorda]
MTDLANEFLDDIESSGEERESGELQPIKHEMLKDERSKDDMNSEDLMNITRASDDKDSVSHISKGTANQVRSLLEEINECRDSEKVQSSLLVRCAPAIAAVDEQIKTLLLSLRKAYAPRFPELETFIFDPVDYARVARLTVTAEDLSKIDLRSILPSGTAITVQLTASSSTGRMLKKDELQLVLGLCEDLLRLDEWRTELLRQVELNAGHLAPNLVAITGGAVAAKLIGYAGGLRELAQMPGSNVKLLGKQRKSLQGTSTATTRIHEGTIHTCPLVTSLPKQYRSKAGDVTACKAVLAARVDLGGGSHDGSVGQAFRENLEAKFDKWMEPPPARTLKPLPIPGDEAKKRHRGGKRARKEKERLGITEMRRLANRVAFGEQEQEGDLEGEGVGMLGADGSKTLRVKPKKSLSVSMAAKRRLDKQKKKDVRSEAEKLGLSGGAAVNSGTEIQLAATPSFAAVKPSSESSYFGAARPFHFAKKRKISPQEK